MSALKRRCQADTAQGRRALNVQSDRERTEAI
jgi:hypothetical protein